MGKLSNSINLAHQEKQNVIDTFLYWVLTIGRVLVIITESIALGMLLYRFGLDKQLVDLHDQIKQEQVILGTLTINEQTYRNLQQTLASIKTHATQAKTTTTTMTDIVDLARGKVTFNSLSISNKAVTLEAVGTSMPTIIQFVNALKSYSGSASVDLQRVENRLSKNDFVVGVSITLK